MKEETMAIKKDERRQKEKTSFKFIRKFNQESITLSTYHQNLQKVIILSLIPQIIV